MGRRSRPAARVRNFSPANGPGEARCVRLFGLTLLLASLAPAAAVACEPEDALTEAAAILALGGTLDDAHLGEALREVGSDLPNVRAVRGDDRTVRASLDALARNTDAPLVCGRAEGPLGVIVLVSARGGALTFEEDGRLRVALAPHFREPRVVIATGDGATRERLVAPGDAFRLPAGLPRPIHVQLVATGPAGPRPVAERRLGDGDPIFDAGSLDGALVARVARVREAVEVRELRDNRILTELAERHAERVCASGQARHEGEGLDPEARARRAGIVARLVGEVVARARSEDAAFEALMTSPSHRRALTDPRFTDVGVGVRRRGGTTCVVVELAAWPRFLGR